MAASELSGCSQFSLKVITQQPKEEVMSSSSSSILFVTDLAFFRKMLGMDASLT